MIPVKEALGKLIAITNPTETEEISILQSSGRVLAQRVYAKRDQPPYNSSSMDGYAVRSKDVEPGKKLSVIDTLPAGSYVPQFALKQNKAVKIFTGSPLPKGADRVVIQEDVIDSTDFITINDTIDENRYIRPIGTDFKKGFSISAPKALTTELVSLLAAMNQERIKVYKKPVVSILATGDELVMPGDNPEEHQIVASNIFGLQSILQNAGCEVKLLPIARDNESSLVGHLKLGQPSDLIITIGGASVGDYDLVKLAAEKLGYDFAFYKILMRPGKPLFAGKNKQNLLIGLPGNPVSAIVCGYVFLLPVIQAMQGLKPTGLRKQFAKLSSPLGPNGPREHYLRSKVDYSSEIPTIQAHERQDSSLLRILNESNALMIRKPNEKACSGGEIVPFLRINKSIKE